MQDITIATPFVRQACVGALRAGYHLDPILESCGIKPWVLERERMRVPVDAFVQLLQTLMRLMDDELLGLLERPQRLGCFSLIARSAIHEARLIDAMQHYVEAANLIEAGAIHQLEQRDQSLIYSLRLREGTRYYSHYLQ